MGNYADTVLFFNGGTLSIKVNDRDFTDVPYRADRNSEERIINTDGFFCRDGVMKDMEFVEGSRGIRYIIGKIEYVDGSIATVYFHTDSEDALYKYLERGAFENEILEINTHEVSKEAKAMIGEMGCRPEAVICSCCGETVSKAKFCSVCGARLDEVKSVAEDDNKTENAEAMKVAKLQCKAMSDEGLTLLVNTCRKAVATVGGDGYSEIVLYLDESTGEYWLHTYSKYVYMNEEVHASYKARRNLLKELWNISKSTIWRHGKTITVFRCAEKITSSASSMATSGYGLIPGIWIIRRHMRRLIPCCTPRSQKKIDAMQISDHCILDKYVETVVFLSRKE